YCIDAPNSFPICLLIAVTTFLLVSMTIPPVTIHFKLGRKAVMPLAKMNENDCRFNHGVEQLPSDLVRLGMPVNLFAPQNARGNALIEFEQFARPCPATKRAASTVR